MSNRERCIIIGAGPAGLTAAHELDRLGTPSVIFEQDDCVGGISRTVEHEGYRFDIGGHRFFTKVEVVQRLWEEIIGDDFLLRPRLSRIYYGDRFFDYPLKPLNALIGLGPIESVRIVLSYLKAQMRPHPHERSFEEWVTNRFGRRLYEIFFKTYTEKVWGIPCSEIGAEWAAQRIKDLDLAAAVKHAILPQGRRNGQVITTLIDRFYYPRLGPGMMWERCRDLLDERGVTTHLSTPVVSVHHDGRRVSAVTVRTPDGEERRETASQFISSMPIRTLLRCLDPTPPPDILEAAGRLRYRDYLTIALIVDRESIFPDNWIYVHSPKVRLGRIQNFKNWSPEMVPDPGRTSLGLEYFVQEGDELWSATDADLIALGTRECAAIGLIEESEVVGGTVIRMPKAYPVYDGEYQAALRQIRSYIDPIENLQLVGRNGQHRYNNQDHSMVTAIYAAQRIHGAVHDVWDVNVEAEYHEAAGEAARAGGRLVPARVDGGLTAEVVRSVFARYDSLALGAALGLVFATGIYLATVILLIKGGDLVGRTLSLLGNYLVGYDVSWTGALVGFLEVGVVGFIFGYLVARAINVVVGWHETAFRRKLEMMRTLE